MMFFMMAVTALIDPFHRGRASTSERYMWAPVQKALVVEYRIVMGSQGHAAGMKDDTVRWICGDIVEQLVYDGCRVCRCCSLLRPDCAEGNEELVVDDPRVVEEGSNDTLHTFDARFIEPWRSIVVGCQLLLGAVDNFMVLVGGELLLCGCLVPFTKQQVADVVVHRQAARAFTVAICVVPP